MAHANIYHHICLSPFPSLGSIHRSRGGRRRRRREEMADGSSNSSASVAMGQEVQAFVENKYGGMVPKKPLISKDQERAYFDSADWVLGKQAANSGTARAATAIEFLKPKLKRTPHHQLPPRKPTCASS
uniref:Negatively light-regulated protein n=1 Tax=Zea mays TaxID=4577 RepID=A0A804QID9_MAIZE|eukprot:XP_008651433.1 negatively light-regulated protein isoform X3 [Zea mays]